MFVGGEAASFSTPIGAPFLRDMAEREPSLLSELEYVVNLDLKSFASV